MIIEANIDRPLFRHFFVPRENIFTFILGTRLNKHQGSQETKTTKSVLMRLPEELVTMILDDFACPVVPSTKEDFVTFAERNGLNPAEGGDFTFTSRGVGASNLVDELPARPVAQDTGVDPSN